MKQAFSVWVAAMLAGAALGLAPVAAQADMESEILAFEAADAIRPPPACATLFVGSSSIRIWPGLATAFPNRYALNRGFGGSKMSDVLHYFDRVVTKYRSPLVVVYEGENDLAVGKTVAQVAADYASFLARMEAQMPATRVAFLSVKPSPSRTDFFAQIRELNDLIRALAESRGHRYIDVFTPMLDASGQPRPELFQPDRLHLNAAGYEIWQAAAAPVLAAMAGPACVGVTP